MKRSEAKVATVAPGNKYVWLVTYKTVPDFPDPGTVRIDGVYFQGDNAWKAYETLKKDDHNEWVEVVRLEVKDG